MQLPPQPQPPCCRSSHAARQRRSDNYAATTAQQQRRSKFGAAITAKRRRDDSASTTSQVCPPPADLTFDFGSRSLQELSIAETFKFLASNIQNFSAFELTWQIAGNALIEYGPASFIQNTQAEVRVIPRSICIEVFSVVQKTIVHEVSTISNGGATPIQVSPVVQAGVQASIPSRIAFEQDYRQPEVNPQVLAHLFSPGSSSHGGSAFKSDKRRKVSYGGPAQSNIQLFQPTMTQFMQPTSIAQQFPALSAGLTASCVVIVCVSYSCNASSFSKFVPIMKSIESFHIWSSFRGWVSDA